jgi:hypothetical protein
MLITKNFDGLVLKMSIKGIEKVNEDNDYVYLKAMAGEAWHGFVLYCVANNYSGVENLSLIPGYVGAAPMQNIGAYGVEIKDTCHEVEAYAIENNDFGRPASPLIKGMDDFTKKLESLLEAEKISEGEISKRRIERAGHILCYETDEQTLAAIKAIEAQAEIDGHQLIDEVAFEFNGEEDRVLVWEPLAYKYNCDEFLKEIND